MATHFHASRIDLVGIVECVAVAIVAIAWVNFDIDRFGTCDRDLLIAIFKRDNIELNAFENWHGQSSCVPDAIVRMDSCHHFHSHFLCTTSMTDDYLTLVRYIGLGH